MPDPKKRPSETAMMKAVGRMEKWKMNVMFVLGLPGMGGIVYWFVTPEEGHDHGMVELFTAAGFFGVCAFFVFPLGITRLADKFWPDKWKT